MKIHWTKLTGLTMILLIAGCMEQDIEQEKNDPALNVRVHFRIGPKPEWEGKDILRQGDIGIQDIQFEGIREDGRNVYVEEDPIKDWPCYRFCAMESI